MRCFSLLFLIFVFSSFKTQINSSIQHNGVTRDFVYYTPSNWNSSDPLPLLVVMHGLTQTGNGIMNITGFNDIAEDNNFIVCYPDGVNNSFNANMNVTVSTADDLGFIESLYTYFETNFNSDPNKRYLCGFSTGGFMSHKLACESSFCFAAIATVSGNMSDTVYNNCSPSHPTSVLHIHGTLDPVVSYNGSATSGVSVDASIEKWRIHLGCNLSPQITPMPDNNIFDFSSPERHIYFGCSNSSLELIKINGGGHQWPGIPTLIGGLGNINMDFYSPEIIWDFLNGKSCPESTHVSKSDMLEVNVFPNPTNNTVSFSVSDYSGSFNVNVFDLNGRLLKSLNDSSISLESFEKGVYLISLSFSNKTTMVKVIKQ